MRKYWTFKKLMRLAALLIVAVVIPFIINELYMVGEGYITVWNGEDVLSFYGDVLGAAATIVGVYYTFDYTNFKKKEEDILAVRPMLASCYDPEYDYKEFGKFGEDIIFVNLDNKMDISTERGGTPDIIKNAIKQDEQLESEKNVEEYKKIAAKQLQFMNRYHLIKYEVTNYGAGNARGVEMRIGGKKFIPKFVVKENKTMQFKMLIDMEDVKIGDEICLDILFTYSDIYNRMSYMQKEKIYVLRDTDGSLSTRQPIKELLSEPEEIKVQEVDQSK